MQPIKTPPSINFSKSLRQNQQPTSNPIPLNSSNSRLLNAASTGNLQAPLNLTEKPPEMLSVPTEEGQIIQRLLEAARSGNTKHIITLLTEKGVSPNITDHGQQTALHLAAQYNHVNITKTLLELGANIHTVDKKGRTPAHLAAYYGAYESLKQLIAAGTQVSRPDRSGDTALHLAIYYGHKECALLLIEHSNITDYQEGNSKFPPLHLSIYRSLSAVTKAIIESINTQKLNEPAANGKTPLHLSAEKNNVEISTMLIEKGASVNRKNDHGNLPLHIAAQHEDPSLLTALIGFTTNINTCNNDGQTALHLASKKARPRCVIALLQAGADDAIFDRKNNSALDFARDKSTQEIFLLSQKAKETQATHTKALEQAIEIGDELTIYSILTQCPWDEQPVQDLNFSTSPYHQLPHQNHNLLQLAVIFNRSNSLKMLLDAFPHLIDAVTAHNQTPAHLAASLCHLSILDTLTQAGANLTLPFQGKPPLLRIDPRYCQTKSPNPTFFTHSIPGTTGCIDPSVIEAGLMTSVQSPSLKDTSAASSLTALSIILIVVLLPIHRLLKRPTQWFNRTYIKRDAFEALQKENDALKETQENLAHTNFLLERKVADQQKTQRHLSRQIDHLEHKYAESEYALKRECWTNYKLGIEKETLLADKNRLDHELNQKTKTLDDLEQKHAFLIVKSLLAVSETKDTDEALKSQLKETKETNEKLKSQLKEIKNKEVNYKIISQTIIKALQTESTTLQKTIEDLEIKNESSQAIHSILQNRLKAHSQSLREKTEALKSAKQTLKQLEHQVECLSKTQEKLDDSETLVKTLKTQVNESKTKLQQLNKTHNQLREQIRKLIENHFFCPISLVAFEDPVVTADGHTYSKAEIEEWIAKKGELSAPLTSEPIADLSLRPNHLAKSLQDELQNLIAQFPAQSS